MSAFFRSVLSHREPADSFVLAKAVPADESLKRRSLASGQEEMFVPVTHLYRCAFTLTGCLRIVGERIYVIYIHIGIHRDE